MRKTTIGALALVMMAAVPVRAQQHAGHGQHGAAQPQDHAAMMMKHHAAHAALEHRQELGLSAEQVQRLTAVDSAQSRAMRDHCARMQPAAGAQAHSHDPAMHQQMMAAMDRFGEDALAVLTPAQKARLDSLHAAHHGAGAAGQGGHSMHGGAAGHGNAAGEHGPEHCGEMKGGHGEHAGHTPG